MSTLEKILEQIKSLTPAEQEQVKELVDSLQPMKELTPRTPLSRAEYENHLLKKGLIKRVPPRTGQRPDDLKDFKPIEVKGKPMSETIIEERR